MIKPFGAKAARFIRRSPNEDATLNVLEGAIRSSKTWAINAKLVGLTSGIYSDWVWPGGIGLITAKSKQSARTNMLEDIFSIAGEGNYRYNQQSGQLILFGKKFLVCGASDESSWKAIRGSTVGLWIADEVGLYPKSFFEMALSRLSLKGSRAYGSTNPENPYHFLKTDYIDSNSKRDSGDFWSEKFLLDDNPNIDESVKARYRRQYTGVFHRRYILGEWCIAEGAIYRDVLSEGVWYDDQARPVGLLSPRGHLERWIAVDAGVMNPQVYLDIYDDGRTGWIEQEYYHEGRATKNTEGETVARRQKTDREYADDLINGSEEHGWPAFPKDQRLWPGVIIDPSAASFKAELMSRGVWVVDADNEVSNGIRRVSSMLALKKLRINRLKCPNTVRELQTYAWNEEKIKYGEEEPIKSHDHCPDAIRYWVNTRVQDFRIAA